MIALFYVEISPALHAYFLGKQSCLFVFILLWPPSLSLSLRKIGQSRNNNPGAGEKKDSCQTLPYTL